MNLDPVHIDQEQLESEASRAFLLIDAIRQRDHARAMLKTIWPEVSRLREELEPLEKEFSRWATKYYSAEVRLAEVRKRIVAMKKGPRKRAKEEKPLSEKEMLRFLQSQTEAERRKLYGELLAMVEEE